MDDTRKDTKPAALTVCRPDSTTGPNQDGRAVCANDSTDLATIADALSRIADELEGIEDSLSTTDSHGSIVSLAEELKDLIITVSEL